MALSAAVVRAHADALNILFNAQQASVILALVDAATEATGIPSAVPTADGEYTLTITDGVATWTEVEAV